MVNVPLGGTGKLPTLLLRAITPKVNCPIGTGTGDWDSPPMRVGAGVTVMEAVEELAK